MPNASGGFLHVPNKSWVGTDLPIQAEQADKQQLQQSQQSQQSSTKEKQNYDELERWARRLPRGLIASVATSTPLVINNGDLTDKVYLQTNPIQMELGRVYKAVSRWPDLISPSVADGIVFHTQFVPVRSTQSTNVGAALYKTVPDGGYMVQYATPTFESVGLYSIQLIAHWWAGPSATITIAAGPGANGAMNVEDLGMTYAAVAS